MTNEPIPADLSNADLGHDRLGIADLRHADSIKWTQYPEGVLPLWIADMDFPVAPPILAALHDRLERSIGYAPEPGEGSELLRLMLEKFAAQGLDGLSTAGLKFLPGVVTGLYAGVQGLTAPGDRIVTMTPIYHPFHLAIAELGRVPVGVPLINGPERWEIDWDALETACQGAKMLMVCHPHNPTGRVWTHTELERLRDLVVKYDLYALSDELHADLRYTADPFEAFAAAERVRSRSITVTGPCKAFNTAGLGIGVMATHNPDLMAQVKRAVAGLTGHPSALSLTMWHAALTDGGPWLSQTVEYLRGNRDFLTDFLRQRLPWVRFHPVEATYLAWLDLRDHPQATDIQKYLLETGKIAVHNGPLFAPADLKGEYQGFVRVNFAMPRTLLAEALERLAQALG